MAVLSFVTRVPKLFLDPQHLNIPSIQVSTFSLLSVVLVCLCSPLIVRFCWRRRKLYALAAKLPGPKLVPFLGNALEFTGDRLDLFQRVNRLIEAYPTPSRLWMGPFLYVVIYSPTDLETILNDPRTSYKDRLYTFLEIFIGKGLITGNGPSWKQHRKIIAPTLKTKVIESYIDTFNEQSQILVQQLELVAGPDTEIDILSYVTLCTIDIVAETLMGVKLDTQSHQHADFVESTECMYTCMYARLFKVWLHPDCIYRWTGDYRAALRAKTTIYAVIDDVVRAKKAEFEARCRDEEAATKRTTLAQLLEANRNGEYFTEDELRTQIFTVYTAGQDTTAISIAFAFLMLAMHPDVQERVYEEICEVMGKDNNTAIAWSAYPNLSYLDLVIKETHRLFPIAPFITRQIRDEIPLESCTLPAGCSVLLAIFQTHRLQEYWPEPNRFNPDRFRPENSANRHPFAYIPFSAGIRNCVGQKYSNIMLKTIITHVVRKYELHTELKYEDLELMADISVRSRNGYKIKLQLRP